LWVLNAALRECGGWRQAGWEIGVAINLSAQNLHHPQLPGVVAELLQTWSVPPSALRVEITESTLMADPARALETLTSLSRAGVRISIDDYGTGYSSLAYLKRLPVDEIKIDRSFVSQMVNDDNDAAIVRSTVGLGHDLGLTVVAEGVETRTTWDLLASLGCDVAQGYYLSPPLPASKFIHWLGETKNWTTEQGVKRETS
ncbi:MAG: EAL domain-containing protein, partial [Chloroflexota bacterium]